MDQVHKYYFPRKHYIMMNSSTTTVDKSTKASTSCLKKSTPKPTVTVDQSSSSKYFESLPDGTGNSAFVPVKRALKDRMERLSAESTARKVKMTCPKKSPKKRMNPKRTKKTQKDTSGKVYKKDWRPRRALQMSASHTTASEKESEKESTEQKSLPVNPRMSASYTSSEEDSKEERPESTPEQESKIQSLQTLVAKQSKEIVEYQEEMTILQLEKEEILQEVCTLKRKIDELQGEDDEVFMSVTKKVTGHTMKISAFWNLMTSNPFKSVKRSDNSE